LLGRHSKRQQRSCSSSTGFFFFFFFFSFFSLQFPASDWSVLVCPSGGLAVGVAGRRWLVVHQTGAVFLLGPGAETGLEQECSVNLDDGDSPWRLFNTASSEIHNWVLTTREGSAWEISFYGGELNARRLNAGGRRREWTTWISSLFVSAAPSEKILACCNMVNNFWLVATDSNLLRAFRSFPEESSLVWESEILTESGTNSVVDMLFSFKLWQLFVLREKEAAIHVYRVDEDNGSLSFVSSIGLSAPAGAEDFLALSEAGNVIVRSKVIEAVAVAAAVSAPQALEVSAVNDASLSVTAIENSVPLSLEKIEQLSNELCGVFANDLWLVWAEKVNNVAFEKIGQILRSRVVKHRALFVANPESKLLADNNAAIAATHGFFLGWIDLLQAGEEEDHVQKIKSEIVSVIGASIGPSNSRRLAARNVNLFSMLWSCCPVITHVLDLLKKFASPQVFMQEKSVCVCVCVFFFF
jgi:hypothetical protein